MRVLEPKRPVPVKTEPKKPRRFAIVLLAVILAAVLFYFLSGKVSSPDENNSADQQQAVDKSEPDDDKTDSHGDVWRQFSGNEFRLLYDQLLQPDLTKVDLPPSITGNETADTRIRELAEMRGYRLRSSPTVQLSYVDGFPAQKPVAEAWLGLKEAAADAGLQLSLTSAYRSVSEQRQLFVRRLQAEGATTASIAAGESNKEIVEVLKTTAVPGYSKHHTGYTLDWYCAGWEFEDFASSDCHDWLAADNYRIAKEYGFIPSYPDGADLQGPDPEAWEYVWVGTEALRN